MKTAIWAILLASLFPAVSGHAAERDVLGYGTIFNNDLLGDGEDRWRTGSYTFSALTGPGWSGGLPDGFGDIIEYRVHTEIFAPANLTSPAPGDRRYAGVLSFGAHTHFSRGLVDYAVGGDMVFIGPQTGVSGFQDWIHGVIDSPSPAAATRNQIGNEIYPTVLVSATIPVPLSSGIEARPFVEAQAGVETFVRLGGDFIFGGFNQNDLLLRDATTGHLYDVTHDGGPGVSFLLGGDFAVVSDSAYLKSSDGYRLSNGRVRVRAGVNWQGERFGMFYGLTWMGEEFKAQPEAQVVGTVNLRLNF